MKHSAQYKGVANPPENLREYALDEWPPIEAQIIDICDEIAYNNHDLDDGIESRLLDIHELQEKVAIVREIFQRNVNDHPAASFKLLVNATIIQLINTLVSDLIDNLKRTIEREGIRTLEDVRRAPRLLVSFSDEIGDKNRELKSYLYSRMYNHYRVRRMKNKARRILEALFREYQADPGLLPTRYQVRAKAEGKERIICDYIAGMTDRYAIDEYTRLLDPNEKV